MDTVIQDINCPNCGRKAERHYLNSQKITRTQCSHCDYLMIVSQVTGKVLEAYAPSIIDGKVLALTLQMDEKSNSIDEIATELATLCKALNAYHIACGGNGLEIDDWETVIAVRELVGA